MGKGTDFAERHTAQKATVTQEPSVFSGGLKCPECGGNLNFHFNQKNHDIKFFSCQNHNSGLRKCSATHYIRLDFLEQVVLYEVNRLAAFANEYESEFVKAMVQSAERTSYQPNPIYERQANEIESISKTISEQSRTIKSLQEERDKLGIFKGREKKELQNKIDNFERLRRSNLDKLGALGVSEPSKADEAVKEKRSVAAQEQNRAKAAMQNRGAKERAEEVKAAFLEAAKQIPADQRQEILDRMGQQKEIPTMGRLQYYQAEAEARRQLDTALKQEAQTRERNRTHDRDRGI